MNIYKKLRLYYSFGGSILNNPVFLMGENLNQKELNKTPQRYDILNFLLRSFNKPQTQYLEIGVRNPKDNYDLINSEIKYSVDPGVEFAENPVDFKMTSDLFFEGLNNGTLLDPETRFDVIFIDGLHLADQVERDIENSLKYINDEGFIVLHDCNPPTEWHAREDYMYRYTPASKYWNGTTWKAFYKFRLKKNLTSICVDTDWGVGIITKQDLFNTLDKNTNPYFEFRLLNENRKVALNLSTFKELTSIVNDRKNKKKNL